MKINLSVPLKIKMSPKIFAQGTNCPPVIKSLLKPYICMYVYIYIYIFLYLYLSEFTKTDPKNIKLKVNIEFTPPHPPHPTPPHPTCCSSIVIHDN